MSSPALTQLESLLTLRKLDHTLAFSSHLPVSWNEHGFASTGSARLDEQLAGGLALRAPGEVSNTRPGGLPRGQISEIIGPRSSGRQSVLVSWFAAATSRGELTALVDPLDMFDPPSAAAHGVDLTRLLWVRGRALGPQVIGVPREAGELRVQIERAVKALNLILQASGGCAGSGFGLVALDLGEVPLPVVGRLPFTTWRRLHRVIEGSETVCVVVASEPLARSAAGITLALDRSCNAENAKVAEDAGAGRFHLKNSAFSVPSADSALKSGPRHLRLFPELTIEGRAVHARGMRTEHVVLTK
jgi:recA bacterial DNA recombination protein